MYFLNDKHALYSAHLHGYIHSIRRCDFHVLLSVEYIICWVKCVISICAGLVEGKGAEER